MLKILEKIKSFFRQWTKKKPETEKPETDTKPEGQQE